MRTTEPAAADDNATEHTVREQPVERPAVVAMVEVAEENPTQDKARASTPTRGDETAGTPPPSSVVEEEDKVPSPPPAEEERNPTPAPAEASTLEGSPSRGKGPMIPITVAGRSVEGEEAQAASDDEVEEIQGRPHDGRQHVYVWRQHGDHWAGHEEIAETEQAERVERAAKRLVNEVKVSGRTLHCSIYIPWFVHCVVCLISAGRHKNGEVPEKVLRPN